MISKTIKIFLIILVSILFVFLTGTIETTSAKTYTNTKYTIDYFINEDSTVEVEEKIEFRFDGTFYEVSRWITLEDQAAYLECQNNPALQCGGFDFLIIEEVIDENGQILNENDYRISQEEQFISLELEEFVNVIYEFAPDGQFFDGELFEWGLSYKVYGNLGFFDDYIFFYWDTASNREVAIDDLEVNIHFPKDVDLDIPNDLVIYGYTDYFYDLQGDVLNIRSDGPIAIGDDYTIALKLPKDLVVEPGSIKVESENSSLDILDSDFKLEIEGREVQGQENEFNGIPSGTATYKFTSEYYQDFETEVTIVPGEQTVVVVPADPKPVFQILFFVVFLCNCFGFMVFPFAILYPIFRWYTKGRDKGGKGIIVPKFEPPKGMDPVLMGSLKDEKPDLVDITATIINVAYKGYITIEEMDKKAKDFKFKKLKDFKDLPELEKKIMVDIFKTKEETTTKKLKNTFYIKLPGIKNAIYKEMKKKGYFANRPDKVRGGNMSLGIAIVVLSISIIVGSSTLTSGAALFVTLVPFSALTLLGILTMIFSFIMPAKTRLGTRTLEEIKGFKMYLETAEKYTLQNLIPETFEKYLAYAIVFGVEKKWAEKFKDIYKGKPSWYEGTSQTIWNPILISNSLSSLNSTAARAMTSKPASSGSSSSSGWSGGGWSGGGGFSGGFSGGGAGGGGFGAR